MGQVGQWHGHVFEASHQVVRGFTDLTIKGGIESDTKEVDGQKYVYRKSGSAAEISMTIHLFASLGCDVQAEAMLLVEEAQAGACDYFYLGADKLLACMVMLTGATVQEITIAPGGQWVQASVAVTFSQSDGTDAASGKGGGGKGKSLREKILALADTKAGGSVKTDTKADSAKKSEKAAVEQVVRDTDTAVNKAAKAASLAIKNPGASSSSPGTRFAQTSKKIVPDTK